MPQDDFNIVDAITQMERIRDTREDTQELYSNFLAIKKLVDAWVIQYQKYEKIIGDLDKKIDNAIKSNDKVKNGMFSFGQPQKGNTENFLYTIKEDENVANQYILNQYTFAKALILQAGGIEKQQEVTNFFTCGYELVMAIRSFFTGQEIYYRVMSSGQYKKETVFYEKTFDEHDFLGLYYSSGNKGLEPQYKNVSLITKDRGSTYRIVNDTLMKGKRAVKDFKITAKDFTLRATMNQRRMGLQGLSIKEKMEKYGANNFLMTEMYNYVYYKRNLTNTKKTVDEQSSKQVMEIRGTAFEMYRNFIVRYESLFKTDLVSKYNSQKLKIQEEINNDLRNYYQEFYNFRTSPAFSANYMRVIEYLYENASKNKDAFYKGGDLGLEQLKFGVANLFDSLITLRNVIYKLQRLFSVKTYEEFEKGLKELFTKDLEKEEAGIEEKFKNEVNKAVNDEAVESIHEIVEQFKNINIGMT